MILYITGLTGVNREMIEAGRIDGASGFTMLWNIVLPQLKPATLIAVVVTIVGSLRSFDLIASYDCWWSMGQYRSFSL